MRPNTFLFSLILAVCLSGVITAADKVKIIRSWKSMDGRELKAELLEFDAKEIKIKRMTDFQIMKVPLDKFSPEDQAFVAGLVHKRNLDEGLTKGPYAEKITGSFVKAVSKQGLNYQIFGNPNRLFRTGSMQMIGQSLHFGFRLLESCFQFLDFVVQTGKSAQLFRQLITEGD
jgi:hypothetical protein